jgi:hypothetical protein
MLPTCFLLFLLSALVNAQLDDDRKPLRYKVLRTVPYQNDQFKYLEQLEHNASDMQINFWTSPVRLGSAVDLMMPINRLDQMQKELFRQGLSSHIIINDVEK